MQIENILQQEELEQLQSLVQDLSKINPEIKSTTMTMDELNILKKLNSLEEKIDNLARLINQIFDGHVLINGRFEKIIV